MTRILLAVLLLAGAGVPAVAVGGDDGIRGAWTALDAHWNARNADRFSELFTEDATFGFVDRGTSLDGRAAIHASFAERFPQFAPTIRHHTSVQTIREIAAGVSTVDGTVEIVRLGDDGPTVIRNFVIFAVMLHTDNGWRIDELRAYQLSD